jgi:hypothetical protein
MKVALWAEIRRLFEIEKLSKRAIAQLSMGLSMGSQLFGEVAHA